MEKVPGYLLFLCGLLIMLASLFSVFQVFTGRSATLTTFNFPAISLPPQTIPGQGDKTIELFPQSIVNQISNIIGHLILMSFISSTGYKLSLVGVQLLRPIQVKVQEIYDEKKPEANLH